MSVVHHHAGGNMAYSAPSAFAMNGTPSSYPTMSGNVRVDQMNPLVLGQLNSFRLDASEAGKGTLDLSVGPPGRTLPHEIRNIGTQLFLIEFTPDDPVDHEVSIQFNEVHIPGSPFVLKAPYMDISSVIVCGDGLVMAKVHQQATFNINATRMPSTVQPLVNILGPQGSIQANIITTDQGQYRVAWAPTHAGDHEIRVTMAGHEVPRSPFRVKVADPKQVIVDCPTFANLGNTANVKVDISRAGVGKLMVKISADGKNLPNSVYQDGPSLYRFSFKPNTAKLHEITVEFDGESVHGSPFQCMVSGGSRNVVLTDKQMVHYYGNPVEVEIDARNAGEGQIVAEVRSLNGGVPSDLVPTSTKKIYLLSFFPKEGGEHTVTITFNDEPVPQSPLSVHIQGGPVQQDNVSSSAYSIRNDSHVTQQLPPAMTNLQRTESLVYQQAPPPPPQQQVVKETVYTTQHEMAPAPAPTQVVREQTMYTSQPSSLPSTTVQRDLTRTITYQPQYESAMANESTYFEINPHGLSQKDLDVRLEDPQHKQVPLKVSREGEKYRYEFTPRQTGKYQVFVDIDDTPLPGSPFIYFVQPSSGVVVTDVTQEADVGEEMFFIVDASAAGSGDLDVEVSCNGQLVRIKREPLGQSQYRYTYIPKQGGEHLIDVQYNYERVPGCPIRTHVNETYSRSLERNTSAYGVQGVSGRGIQSAPVSQQAYFIIDMHGRNWELTDVEVDVQGFPSVPVDSADPAKAPPGGGKRPPSSAGYETDDSVFVRTKAEDGAPNGQSVPCKLFLESPNEIRVEYQTPYVGRHLVDIYCKGKRVAGSPYTVEVFDPKKVGLEMMAKESYMHEETEFEVINDEAGSADMECRVISPSGRIIPSHVVNTDRGMKVKYTPEEPGVYYVHTYIGGVEIPGSPMTQVVRAHTLGSRHSRSSHHHERRDSNRYHSSEEGFGKITVSGDGLYRAERDKPAYFYIDTHGMDGTPEVNVEGPHSVAKCSVTPEGAYRFKVMYIPVETGVYDIYVRWYNQEIDGSPFHPRVVDARKVRAKGDWQSKLDKEQRIALEVGKMKRLIFDVTEAGPGELKADVRHVASGRAIPVTITEKDAYHYYVDFVPDHVGDYLININWTDTPIPNSPIRGFATDVKLMAEAQASGQSGGKSGKEFSSTTTKKVTKSGGSSSTVDHSKVVLSGTGLKEGIAGQTAEFYIDGSKAVDGEPVVILKNSRLQHIPVDMVKHGNKSYKCTYLVNEPGAHLLFISWGDRDLLNSPYTVMIKHSHDVTDSTLKAAANGYQMSGYSTQQRSASQQKKGQAIPVNQQDAGAAAAGGASGQTGMSKHFVRKAKMTTSNNQQQSQNVGENFQLLIDANMMAGGELVARCLGPTMSAKCELVQKEGGMYALNVRPQEAGEHHLSVTYKGEHIEGSPFLFSVKGPAPPDPSQVKVRGPGVEHGILANFESKFFVDTEGAGAGNLSVKMRGPKGGFQATMKRISQASRTIECTYNPAEVGLYVIHVKWSEVDVPGSPFYVHIFDTHYELDKFVNTGELPTTLREHHVLQIREPTQSYQTSAYQTNTLRTLKKSKKSKKNKQNGFMKGEPVTLVQAPVQAVQPIQYIVKESQLRPQPQFVHVKDSRDANYVEAASGRPVQIVNGGAVSGGGGGAHHQSYYREGHYSSGGGGYSGGHGSKAKFVVPENGPQYVVRR